MKSTTPGNNNDILLREKSITVEDADQISFSDYIKKSVNLKQVLLEKRTYLPESWLGD